MGDLTRIANMLPTSVVTRIARQQASKQDFATSNFRAAPFATYVSGALVLQNATLGPVAATAIGPRARDARPALACAPVDPDAGLRVEDWTSCIELDD